MYFYGYKQHQPHAFVNKLNYNSDRSYSSNDKMYVLVVTKFYIIIVILYFYMITMLNDMR